MENRLSSRKCVLVEYWEKEGVKIEIAEYLESPTCRCLFDLAKEALKIHSESK